MIGNQFTALISGAVHGKCFALFHPIVGRFVVEDEFVISALIGGVVRFHIGDVVAADRPAEIKPPLAVIAEIGGRGWVLVLGEHLSHFDELSLRHGNGVIEIHFSVFDVKSFRLVRGDFVCRLAFDDGDARLLNRVRVIVDDRRA